VATVSRPLATDTVTAVWRSLSVFPERHNDENLYQPSQRKGVPNRRATRWRLAGANPSIETSL